MSIKVRTGAVLKKLFAGQTEVESRGTTIRELLDNLGIREQLCDGDGKLRRHFNIHINDGEDVRLQQGLETPISDGDTVTILSAIAGGMAAARKIWLTFPEELVSRPLIWEVGQKFNVVSNIRQASVSKKIGLVGLELSGEEDEIKKAILFFEDEGISVEPVTLDVVE